MSALIGHEPTCRFCGLTLREHFGAGSRAGGHPFGADHDDPRRAADTDAAMLADLREWWKRQDLRDFDHKDVRLTREEFVLLLAVADERDDLESECEEETAPAFPPLSAKITQPMPPVDIAIEPDTEPCEHKTGTQEGGAIVCAECGLLIAWIRYDFEARS